MDFADCNEMVTAAAFSPQGDMVLTNVPPQNCRRHRHVLGSKFHPVAVNVNPDGGVVWEGRDVNGIQQFLDDCRCRRWQ